MQRDKNEILRLQQRICGHSDEAAFAALFRMCYKSLYHFALRYLHTHEAAEEVVNDVFVKIWKQRATLQEVKRLENYLFIAVKNSSLNYLKQYSHYHLTVNEQETVRLVSLHNPQHDIEWKELHFKLQQAINGLPEQCRNVFLLVKEEGFRFKQVAEILGISPRTVETQLYRAVKKLDAALSEYLNKKKADPNNLIPLLLFIIASLCLQ